MIFTKINTHVCSNKTWWNIERLIVIDNGITMAPIRRSVTACLDKRMFEGFCRSFVCLIARITIAFKTMVGSEAISITTAIIK